MRNTKGWLGLDLGFELDLALDTRLGLSFVGERATVSRTRVSVGEEDRAESEEGLGRTSDHPAPRPWSCPNA